MLGILSELKNKPADDTVTIPYTSERICMHRDKHHCVICFGSNVYGRLGITEQQHQQDPLQLVTIPRLIGTNLKVQHLACGAAHILCCINGDCYSWGKCHFGQLGHGNEWMNCFSPTKIPHENYIRKNEHENMCGFHSSKQQVYIQSVSCGESHSMVITSDGELYSFGCGFNGCLGHGTEKHEVYPRLVSKLLLQNDDRNDKNDKNDKNNNHDGVGVKVKQVAGGKAHTIILTTNDMIYTCGKNQCGQLGLGDGCIGRSHLYPTLIPINTFSIGGDKKEPDKEDEVPLSVG